MTRKTVPVWVVFGWYPGEKRTRYMAWESAGVARTFSDGVRDSGGTTKTVRVSVPVPPAPKGRK